MKGQGISAWIASGSILAIIGVLSFSLAYQAQSIVRGLHERSIIEAINEMEFVKKALHQSAFYSAYQSAYEILKYGGYLTEEGCNPSVASDNLPYWRTGDTICLPKNLESTVIEKLKTIFNEYMTALRAKTEKINIKIPDFQSITGNIANNIVNVQTLTADKLKFTSENLQIFDNPNIKENIKLRITDLVEKGKEIASQNFVKSEIQSAEQKMSDLEGTNCVTIKHEQCGKPITSTKEQILNSYCPNALDNFELEIKNKIESLNFDTPTIDVTLTTKQINSQITDLQDESTCEFGESPNSCGNCLQYQCPSSSPVRFGDDIQLISLDILPRVYSDSEFSCTTCIETTNEEPPKCKQFVFETCQSGTFDSSTGQCVTYTTKSCPSDFQCATYVNSCPSGYTPEGNKCIKTTAPSCPSTGSGCSSASFDSSTGFCFYDQGCPRETGCPSSGLYSYDRSYFCEFEGGNVYKASACSSGTYDSSKGQCVQSVPKSCPSDEWEIDPVTGQCVKYSSPCPSDYQPVSGTNQCIKYLGSPSCGSLVEFGNTGRCYESPQVSGACTLRETLYSKTCTYDYSADASVLVSVKDSITENKKPVYDSVEDKTDLRNLELQFYILSSGS